MNYRRFSTNMDCDFLVIPYSAENIWTKCQLSGNFSRVLMDFGLILPVYMAFLL